MGNIELLSYLSDYILTTMSRLVSSFMLLALIVMVVVVNTMPAECPDGMEYHLTSDNGLRLYCIWPSDHKKKRGAGMAEAGAIDQLEEGDYDYPVPLEEIKMMEEERKLIDMLNQK